MDFFAKNIGRNNPLLAELLGFAAKKCAFVGRKFKCGHNIPFVVFILYRLYHDFLVILIIVEESRSLDYARDDVIPTCLAARRVVGEES